MAGTINVEGAKRRDEWTVPVSEVVVDFSANTRFAPPSKETLEALKDDIKVNGQINPAEVLVLPDKRVKLISGHQRYTVIKEIQEETGTPQFLKVSLFRGNEDEAILRSISENTKRANLSPMDHAKNIRLLMDRFGKSGKEVAEYYHRSGAWVTEMLKLLSLSKSEQMAVHRGELAADAGIALAKIDPSKRDEVLEAASGPQAEPETAEDANSTEEPSKKPNKKKVTKSALTRAARQVGAVDENAPMPRKLRDIKDYFEETFETEPDDSPVKFLAQAFLEYADGKLSDKQMDNRLNKACGVAPTPTLNAKKGH